MGAVVGGLGALLLVLPVLLSPSGVVSEAGGRAGVERARAEGLLRLFVAVGLGMPAAVALGALVATGWFLENPQRLDLVQGREVIAAGGGVRVSFLQIVDVAGPLRVRRGAYLELRAGGETRRVTAVRGEASPPILGYRVELLELGETHGFGEPRSSVLLRWDS